jgi:redox-sensitive bicupin YhaK (pirin superfamily)
MNLMTAGRGIAHSERTPVAQRASGQGLYGIQSWIALPRDKEEVAPSFQHFDAGVLPVIADGGLEARIVAGSAFGKTAPVHSLSPWFYAEVKIAAGRSAPLDNDYEERAIYVVEGEVEIAGDSFEGPRLLIFRPGDRITVAAKSDSRVMFLGGAALEGPRYLWWNFVSSSKERIESAKEDWKQRRFAEVPEESEFIPLPDA